MDRLNDRSRRKLQGVHQDLVRVIEHAAEISVVRIVVTEGLRTLERQKQLVQAGASTTFRSRHLTGHAVDLAALLDGEVRWDWPLYQRLGETVKAAAQDLLLPIEWGGDWQVFKDGPHFQLPFREYPAAQENIA
jgi:peptidoglycan L-alanyl-D-glutamate endopeptidase CwlK